MITLFITSLAWLFYLLLGLPSNYYQNWSFKIQLWFFVFTLVMVVPPITYGLLKKVWRVDYLKNSLWCAFYASIPLAIYDYIYLYIIQDIGLSFLISHWYLTFGYFIVWPEMLTVAWVAQRRTHISLKKIIS